MTTLTLKTSFQAHWFLPLALAIVAADTVLARSTYWRPTELLEAGVIFDLAVLVPLLYGICYRHRGRATWIRAAALSCLGIWLAGHVIPAHHHDILNDLSPLRYVGLAVLLLVELRLAIAIYRAAFSAKPGEAERSMAAASQAGVPPWVTRLMAWEAALWRRAWDWIQRLVGRR